MTTVRYYIVCVMCDGKRSIIIEHVDEDGAPREDVITCPQCLGWGIVGITWFDAEAGDEAPF